jgi:hypothetical protein
MKNYSFFVFLVSFIIKDTEKCCLDWYSRYFDALPLRVLLNHSSVLTSNPFDSPTPAEVGPVCSQLVKELGSYVKLSGKVPKYLL